MECGEIGSLGPKALGHSWSSGRAQGLRSAIEIRFKTRGHPLSPRIGGYPLVLTPRSKHIGFSSDSEPCAPMLGLSFAPLDHKRRLDQLWSDPGQPWAISGGILVNSGPLLVELGQVRPSIGRHRPSPAFAFAGQRVRPWLGDVPGLGAVGPTSANFDRFRPRFGQNQPGIGNTAI